ncbi:MULTISPECIES: Rid family hydrolase [unclassified Pseudomonas]|uniref:RidA family protein n=1 Tax=unclassified Pseudomonas TaxID=196821 RepID=UPI0005D3750F|nr:Rid family hydrolase [Pseudomonas sp. ES3-33]KJH75082.1 endoribonuclease L-PSP [Pseudomonas sp. ES3-33]
MLKTTINPSTVFDSLQYGFSQAVEVTGGRRVLLSGQVGVDEFERTVAPGLYEQTVKAFQNIESILNEAGGNLAHVVMMRIYVAESARDEQDHITRVLLERFADKPPASSWVIVSGLSLPEWLIEIEVEAVLP